MSYILDALKKAESERRQRDQGVPVVPASSPLGQPAGNRAGWWVLAGVIAVAMTVALAAAWWEQGSQEPKRRIIDSAPTGGSVARSDQATAQSASGAETSAVTSKDKPVVASKEETTASSKGERVASSEGETAASSAGETAAPVPPEAQAKTVSPEDATRSAADRPGVSGHAVHISELTPEVRDALPAIDFSGHIYSQQPGERRVRINGQMLAQGQDGPRGLTVEAITPMGAEFRYQGHRFRLDMFESWPR